MIQKINYADVEYNVNGLAGFKLGLALRLWKAKYPEFIDFKKDVINHPSLEDFGNFVKEIWDSIEPVTVKEALTESNTEIRRTYFDCIGVQKLFKELNPDMIDRQVIEKKRHRWDDNNTEELHTFKDVYELYHIDGFKLFDKNRWGQSPEPVYAVRCWCTTTDREYWLYVPITAALGERWEQTYPNADAIRAIAWTIMLDVTNPELLCRQGDIIVAKLSANSETTSPYHISKETYLNLMYSET